MNKEKDKESKDLKTLLMEEEKRKEIIQKVEELSKNWHNLTLEEQIKKRGSLLFDLAILSPADRKLCIEHLAEAGIVNKKDALDKVNKYAKDVGIDEDEDKEPLLPVEYFKDFLLLTPAQDFINNTAYVTIPINLFIDNKMIPVNHIITSEREKFRLCNEELFKRKLYIEREPYPSIRWSSESIENFLNNKTAIDMLKLFEKIYNIFLYYIDFGNQIWAKYITCWVIGTYFHRIFESYPYVHLSGDIESGKTKTLTLISCLAFSGELTFNSTPAYTVKAIHNNHSTCCVDEAERLKQVKDQDNQIIIAMYNSGYKKGAFCGKSEQTDDKKWYPRKLEAYSPKIFASIKGLEPSLNSRCIPITMLKSSNKAIKNREININNPEFQNIRDELYLMLFEYHFLIKIKYDSITAEEIVGREWELWKPILTIAKVIDELTDDTLNLYKDLKAWALNIQSLKMEASIEETIVPKLLLMLQDFVIDNPREDNFYSVSELLDYLKNSGEETFQWLKDEKKQNKGRWLGDSLRRAGVIEGRAKQRKVDNKNTKGFYISLECIKQRLKSFDLEVKEPEII